MLRALLDLVAPHRCPACDAPSGPRPAFCPACRGLLVPLLGPGCPICGTPTDAAGPAWPCPACTRRAPPFERAGAAFLFGGPLADVLGRFKAGGIPEFAEWAGAAVAETARRLSLRPPVTAWALAVPVPPDPARLARRGFDPGVRVAAAAARRLGVPLRTDLLVSSPRPRSQRGLPRAERLRVLAEAFRATPRAGPRLDGRAVLLLDDVRTTGATVTTVAGVLRACGARVSVATLALVE